LQEVTQEPEINNFFREIIEKKTKGKLANYEAIKQFRLISEAFSLEKNELTPKLSLKRKVILARYANLIESMYNPQKIDSEKN